MTLTPCAALLICLICFTAHLIAVPPVLISITSVSSSTERAPTKFPLVSVTFRAFTPRPPLPALLNSSNLVRFPYPFAVINKSVSSLEVAAPTTLSPSRSLIPLTPIADLP